MANKRPLTSDWSTMPPPPERSVGRYDREPLPYRDAARRQSPARYSSNISPYGRADHWSPSYDRSPTNTRSNHSLGGRHDLRESNREQILTLRAIDTSYKANTRNEHPIQSPYPSPGFVADTSRVMPKHFTKPLTCFYWATQGRCSKPDDICWYAHHWTGVVAAAPVRIGSGGAVAGREAEKAVNRLSEREAVLKARQDTIISRERDLLRRQEDVAQNTAILKATMQEIYQALNSVDDSNVEATRALERRRTELLNILSKSTEQYNSAQAIHEAGAAVDGALDALAALKVRVDATGHRLKNNVVMFNGSNSGHDENGQAMAGTIEEGGHVEDDFEDNMP